MNLLAKKCDARVYFAKLMASFSCVNFFLIHPVCLNRRTQYDKCTLLKCQRNNVNNIIFDILAGQERVIGAIPLYSQFAYLQSTNDPAHWEN